MIKIFGIVLIGFSSALIGFKCSSDIKRRIDMLSTITYVLGEFANQACYSREPLPEIINSTLPKVFGLYRVWLENLLGLLGKDNAYNFARAWNESLEIFAENGMKESEVNILSEFGVRIVNLNEDRLEEIVYRYIGILDKYTEELKTEYKVKAKMYQSLGILTGLFIIIIVI